MSDDSINEPLVAERDVQPYQLFMLALCGYSILSLAVETFTHLPKEQVAILDSIDNVICGIFLLDFIIHFGQARQKLAYLKWGWIDLLSSIPVVDVFQAGRIVRVIRILRMLRGVRVARILARYLQRHRADGAFLAVIFLSILLLLVGSVAILQVEQVEGANIQTPSDALWWAVVTMTTVGYGDKVPVTTVGRMIACVMMVSGVGLFGTLSGSVTSWILKPVEQRQEVDLSVILAEIASINRRLERGMGPDTQIGGVDLDLERIVQTWPKLSESTRGDMLRLVETSISDQPE